MLGKLWPVPSTVLRTDLHPSPQSQLGNSHVLLPRELPVPVRKTHV